MRNTLNQKIPSKKVQNRKEVEAFIREKAAELSPMWEDHKCTIPMTGAEILDNPKLMEIMDKDALENLNPGKRYYIPHTMTRRVDHYSRMMKALKKGGVKAVFEYVNQTNIATIESAKPMMIGGIKTQPGII